jgi:hypothetical protein
LETQSDLKAEIAVLNRRIAVVQEGVALLGTAKKTAAGQEKMESVQMEVPC